MPSRDHWRGTLRSRRRIAPARTQPTLSITFLLGPTAETRPGGPACVLEYACRFQQRGHDVSIATWPQFLWPAPQPLPNLGFEVPIRYGRVAKRESLPLHLVNRTPRDYMSELQFFMAYLRLLTPATPKSEILIAANWDSVIPAWQLRQGKLVHFPQHYGEVFFALDSPHSGSIQSNPLIKMLCRNAFQVPGYRIANSTWLAGEIRRRFGDEVPVVTHGIDTAKFQVRKKLQRREELA